MPGLAGIRGATATSGIALRQGICVDALAGESPCKPASAAVCLGDSVTPSLQGGGLRAPTNTRRCGSASADVDALVVHDLDHGYHGDELPRRFAELETGFRALEERCARPGSWPG